MNKLLLLIVFVCTASFAQSGSEYLDRQGKVTFFSYTSVENIQAGNNQVRSLFDVANAEIGVSILMKAFVFEKSLMQEHFNESYIESDLYPKATFLGSIMDFDPTLKGTQTRMIKGDFTLKGFSKALDIKAEIIENAGSYTFQGSFEVSIDDYEIKVPPLLSPNIAKTIQVTFNFQFAPNEN